MKEEDFEALLQPRGGCWSWRGWVGFIHKNLLSGLQGGIDPTGAWFQ